MTELVQAQRQAPDAKEERIKALVNAGAKLFGEGQLEPARLHFLAALSLDPLNHTALQNLGAALRNLNHYAAAEAVSRRSVGATKKQNPYCISNLGVSQLGTRKYSEAVANLRRVLDHLPESAPSWHNYGLILYMTGQYEDALSAFDKSLSLGYNIQAHSDKSLCLLSLGRLEEGLAEYECRWKLLHQNKVWGLGIPEWQGEPLAGKRILVHHEQGFGDSLMLLRFLDKLSYLGCNITLAMPKPLVRLCQKSFPFIKVLDLDNDAIDANSFDCHSPLLSVMRHVGVKKPVDIKAGVYLQAEAKPPMKLPLGKVKVGICWASGNHSPVLLDRRRLIPVTQFLPLLDSLEVSLISLQVGEDTRDLVNNGLEGLVFDLSPKLTDFYDTACLIKCLDLVISVDSAVAHLAGALGKPCIMLSPYSRCWRWWSRGSGWPWYNRMKLYYQSSDGSWNEAMNEAIGKALWVVRGMR
jgi:tetratricopeptide (TPR) repeat protein